MRMQPYRYTLAGYAIVHSITLDHVPGRKYYLSDKRGRDKRRDQIMAYARKYREDNKELIIEKRRSSPAVKAYRQSHKAEMAAYGKIWREKNKEKLKARNKEWHRKNADKKRIMSKAWREANAERYKKVRVAWVRANPERWLAICKNNAAKRRNYIRQQALARTYSKECVEFYLNCPKGFHVDHIIPVKGKTVSGLHVPWNLQYLPAHENMVKGNRI